MSAVNRWSHPVDGRLSADGDPRVGDVADRPASTPHGVTGRISPARRETWGFSKRGAPCSRLGRPEGPNGSTSLHEIDEGCDTRHPTLAASVWEGGVSAVMGASE